MDLRDAVRHSRKRGEELFEIRGRILDTHESPLRLTTPPFYTIKQMEKEMVNTRKVTGKY